MAPKRRLTAAIPALLLLAAAPAAGQEEAGAGADTARIPPPPVADSLRPSASDTAEADTIPPVFFPRPVDEPATAAEVHTWTRGDLLAASSLTLEGFLVDRAPGVLPLRASLYFGPHHLVDGLWGPSDLAVVVDGRELPPLEGGQVDLSSISLVGLERVRLVRRAGGTTLELTTLAHRGGDAYSRFAAVTGQPGADMFRGLFANGAGGNFAVRAALDYLNIGGGSMTGNRLDAAARLSWMPWDSTAGIEIRWRSESVERALLGSTETFDRGEVLLHARARPGPDLELEAWAGRSERSPLPAFLAPDAEPGSGEEGSVAVEHATARITATPGGGVVRAEARMQDGEGRPELAGELRAGLPLGPLTVEAGGEGASWEGFTTASATAGLSLRPGWPESLVLRGEASTGTRAAMRPGRPVGDSLRFEFDAVAGGAEVALGPVRLAERFTLQEAASRPALGGALDGGLAPGPRSEVTSWETRAVLPPLPFWIFRDRLRVRGFYRWSDWEGAAPLYLPADLVRGWLVLHDRFYDGNLEIRASGGMVHRGSMHSVSPASGGTVELPSQRVFLAELVVRIDTFRFWIRNGNTRSVEQRDFEGLEFPATRLQFGIRWEFFN